MQTEFSALEQKFSKPVSLCNIFHIVYNHLTIIFHVLFILVRASETNYTGKSCKDILSATKWAASGTYWIKPIPSEMFQVYCDMETHGGGWTLVYSYTFTSYDNFDVGGNAVTPRPNWPSPSANVPISSTPPLNESSLGAADWDLWKDIGREFLVKSNINDWIVCQPSDGSIVTNNNGSISCQNIKNVATACSGVAPDNVKWRFRGPILRVSSFVYYRFEGDVGSYRPVHDPCGQGEMFNYKKGVSNPGGKIYLR